MTPTQLKHIIQHEVAEAIHAYYEGKRLVSPFISPDAPKQLTEDESAARRRFERICEACIDGLHKDCPSEGCPCVCNDSDFRFKHGTAAPVESEPLYMAEDGAGDEGWPAAQ